MAGQIRVLVIEDDKYISHFLMISLAKEEYEVLSAATADEGMFLFSSNTVDIVLLDLGLPDRDGLEVIADIRATSEVPILIISARGQEHEKIEALDAGADDYITKPFHMGELQARIRVAQRKLQNLGQKQETIFSIGALRVDTAKHAVSVGERDIHLTPIEYKLLLFLIANRGKVLTHNYIMKQIWGYETFGDTKTLRVFMANLRRKIEKDTAKPEYIFTEIGVGYRFVD
jgi:two-component system KDP operon response regulator KdpE